MRSSILLGAAVLGEVGGRGDHPPGGLGELAGAQRRILQLADPDRHVEAFGDQLHVAVVEHHVDGDVRELLEELAQHGAQVVHAEVGGDRDPQEPRGRGLHGGHERVGLARVVQHPARAVVVGEPDLGRATPGAWCG